MDIQVTRPLLPELEELLPHLQAIWASGGLTNGGRYHQRLEEALAAYLGVPYISLFTNGTIPLMVALRALNIEGEVITSPYSFVATSHVLRFLGLTPVFVDVDPRTGNLAPEGIEAAITPRTTAILPVHVYGQPCDTSTIWELAQAHGLRVVYDGAHAFGVREDGVSILLQGDMASLSFHATKVFNTLEGGALVSHSREEWERIYLYRNFGIASEAEVRLAGLNGKMDEVRAAYGLVALGHVEEAIAARRAIAQLYRDAFMEVEGLSLLPERENVEYTYPYFPIFVDASRYGESRDALCERLQVVGIYARRYFYPLISNLPIYSGLPSASPELLPHANRLAREVLCLPIYPSLEVEEAQRIASLVARRSL